MAKKSTLEKLREFKGRKTDTLIGDKVVRALSQAPNVHNAFCNALARAIYTDTKGAVPCR